MALTDIAIRAAKPKEKQYKLSDSAGLYILIKPNGSKYWRMKYRIAGKEKLLSIGTYPLITLSEAREEASKAKKQLAKNTDPSKAKQDEKLKNHIKSENSFEKIAREWHANQQQNWTPRHANYVIRRLEADIFYSLGARSIEEITSAELLKTLRVIESRDAIDLAHRALQTCGQIFRYAISTNRAENDITLALRGALKTRKKENYKHLEEKDLSTFLRKLDQYDGDLQTKLALKLLILTFVRTIEVRGAEWKEIDFIKKEWRIPAERMKMRQPHVVPLSDQAISILKEIEPISSHRAYLFPNRNKPTTFISENTILGAIYRLGYQNRTTVHGFRSTASTILNEHGFRSDLIERQLAHAERNKVRASYNHAQYLPERRQMMQWWADYLDKQKILINLTKLVT
jgi:integrase